MCFFDRERLNGGFAVVRVLAHPKGIPYRMDGLRKEYGGSQKAT